MAPKFTGKIDQKNEFLTQKGGYLTMKQINNDGSVNNKLAPTVKYYTKSTTVVPVEILNTGNIDVINAYLQESKLDPNSKEYKHLQERVEVMKYFNELEEYNNEHKLTAVGPMQKNKKGQNVLPGIKLDSVQTSTKGCWSCAMSLLLKGQGVDISPELIRRYRPEFLEGVGPKSAEQTDRLNGNMTSEIFQFSELFGKVTPNTLVKKLSVGEKGADQTDAKNYILDCLTNKHVPVAMCRDDHWVTITGISDDGQNVYIADSLQVPGTYQTKSLDEITAFDSKHPAEFVWAESMAIDHVTKKPFPKNANVTQDPATGAVIPKTGAFITSPDTQTKGIFVADEKDKFEVYIPSMIRDYDKDYKTQKAEYEKFKETNKSKGEELDEAASKSFKEKKNYTFMSEYTKDKVNEKMVSEAQIALDAARRKALKESKKFSDEVIDKMSSEDLEKEFKPQPKVQAGDNTEVKDGKEAEKEAEKQDKKEAEKEPDKEEKDKKEPEQEEKDKKEPEQEKKEEVPDAKSGDTRTEQEIFDSLTQTFREYREEYDAIVAKEESRLEAARRRIRERKAAKKKAESEKKPEEEKSEEEKIEEKKTDNKDIILEDADLEALKKNGDVLPKEMEKYSDLVDKMKKNGKVTQEDLKNFVKESDEKNEIKDPEKFIKNSKGIQQGLKELGEMAKDDEPLADTDDSEEIYRRFNRKLDMIAKSSVLDPEIQGLETSLMDAQLSLSNAFNKSGGTMNQECVEAGAKYMTLVTLSKVCKMPETDAQTRKSLLDPSNIDKCVQDMLAPREGEEKGFAETVTETLCGNKKNHVLTLENKDVFDAMIKAMREENKLHKTAGKTVQKGAQKGANKDAKKTKGTTVQKKTEQNKKSDKKEQVKTKDKKVLSMIN